MLTTVTPTLTWSPVPSGISGFQINLYDLTAKTSASYTADASATSFALPAGALTIGDTYVWNVRCVNGTQSGKASQYLFIQAPVAAPAARSNTVSLKVQLHSAQADSKAITRAMKTLATSTANRATWPR